MFGEWDFFLLPNWGLPDGFDGFPAKRLALDRTERKLVAQKLVRVLGADVDNLARTKDC